MTQQTRTTLLPQAAYDEIVAHARAGKPEEVCGLIRRDVATIAQVIRARNIAEERIENYEIDNDHLWMFHRDEDDMLGIYHSHPVSEAYPSPTDALIAGYPDKFYYICSLEYDDQPVIRAFRLIDHFLEVDLVALRQDVPFWENRPGLFAYYLATDKPVPAALADIAQQAELPFYIIDDRRSASQQGQVVSVLEYQIVTA